MTDNITLWRFAYVLPNLVAAFGMVFVAVLAWHYRTRRGGWAMWVFAVGAAIWGFFEGSSFVGLSPETIQVAWKLGFIGVAVAPLAMVLFVIDYLGYGELLTRRRILFLSLLPAITLLAAWTNEWHGLIWESVRLDFSTPFPTLESVHGSLLWVYFAYGHLLVIGSIIFLIRSLAEFPSLQRRQVRLVIIALVLPLLAVTLYMTHLAPIRNMDLTPLSFNISGFVLIRCFWREQMFELSPVTAREIYRGFEDAVFVVDDVNRVLEMNHAAQKIRPPLLDDSIGQPLSKLFPEAAELLSGKGAERRGEIFIDGNCYDVRMSPLHSGDGRFSGRMLVWREISERKLLEAELHRLAVTDSLTGLPNRRNFLERGEEEIKRAQRYERPLSMIMIDVDHFKNVNDTYGHDAGDRVLTALASVLASMLRSTDCIGRIGGEEFALLLPEIDESGVHEVGRRLVDAVSAMRVPLHNREPIPISITISAGVATLDETEVEMSQFMRRTDNALYQAKHEGRGRLVQCA